MRARLDVGAAVQTPFGKGVVREVRNGGRLLVDVGGRALVVPDADVTAIEVPRLERRSARGEAPASSGNSPAQPAPRQKAREVDLHGLTVEEALARAESALNDAILADLAEVRFIHGRSGGRIRMALHRRLKEIASVRHFEVDPRNAGVTVVRL